MLLLAQATFPRHIAAATVDHGLRPEAAAEATYVADVCAQRGIPHAILRPETPITGNIQSAAREARYALLGAWGDAQQCRWIATAHHGDDQLETLLMRLARGSGVGGLSAIRARNGNVIRPLLDFSKSELEQLCADAGFIPVRDPSNDNAEYDRVAMRQWLAASGPTFDLQRVNRSAAALANANEALDWMAGKLSAQHIVFQNNNVTIDPATLPREILRRMLLLALAHIEPEAAPRGDAVDRALDALPSGGVLTLGNVLCTGGAVWRLTPAPPRRNG